MQDLLNLSATELLSMAVAIIALVISLYSAVSSRRSASAAERAAASAEEALKMEMDVLREAWIEKLTQALPDGNVVESMLASLPEALRRDWRQLVFSAARRNPRTPERRIHELFKEYSGAWRLATGEERE